MNTTTTTPRLVQVPNVFGEEVRFPHPDVETTAALTSAVHHALQELGVPTEGVTVWDTRQGVVSGDQHLRTRNVARAAIDGKTVAWVSWDTANNRWKVQVSDTVPAAA